MLNFIISHKRHTFVNYNNSETTRSNYEVDELIFKNKIYINIVN